MQTILEYYLSPYRSAYLILNFTIGAFDPTESKPIEFDLLIVLCWNGTFDRSTREEQESCWSMSYMWSFEVPDISPMVLRLRSKSWSFRFPTKALARPAAAWSPKWLAERFRRVSVVFSRSMLEMALAPTSPSRFSDKSMSVKGIAVKMVILLCSRCFSTLWRCFISKKNTLGSD